MFYIIGLGLADEKDITIRGLEVIRKPTSRLRSNESSVSVSQVVRSSTRVYLEAYTSILTVQKGRLARLISKSPVPELTLLP